MAGGSSSSSSSYLRAFGKGCAPDNPPIGDYDLVPDCTFPSAPEPICTPTDPPIPIPPVVEGCPPLGNFTGSIGPFPGGAVDINVTYPGGDFCDPDIDIEIDMPCPVSFGGDTFIDVTYLPAGETEATGTIIATDDGDCNLGLSLSLGLPCPVTLAASGEITPGAGTCVAVGREPTFTVVLAENSSSGAAGCSFDLRFELALPCPIVWKQPRVTINPVDAIGSPTGTLFVTPSSSTCDQDCSPELQLTLNFPCPIEFFSDSAIAITYGDSNLTWAETPTVAFAITYGESGAGTGEFCNPKLSLELDLPCPVNIQLNSMQSDNIDFIDEDFFLATPIDINFLYRRWAFGQPNAIIGISLGEDANGVETPCLPILDLSLNLPCPTGGQHIDLPPEPLPGATEREQFEWDQQSLIYDQRQTDYNLVYGADDSLHPYFAKLPEGVVSINQNIGYFEGVGDPDHKKFATGGFGKMEFDSNCNLDLDLSLYIPCGARSPDVKFFDFDSGDELTELDGFSTNVIQDFSHDPLLEGDCAFDDELHLYVSGLGGGGATGRTAEIIAREGINSPFTYTAVEVRLEETGDYTEVTDGEVYDGNLYNTEESGESGQYVNPLEPRPTGGDAGDGDVVLVFQPSPGVNVFVCSRSRYRGTY